MAKEDGVEFEKGAAEDLAESVSADLQRLKTEITKLSTYAGERKLIRCHDVATLVISEKTATVWELADMLAARQSKRASNFSTASFAKANSRSRFSRADVELPQTHGSQRTRQHFQSVQATRALAMAPEKAIAAVQSARKFSKPRLLAGLKALQKADDRLKGGADSPAPSSNSSRRTHRPDSRAASADLL